MPTVRRPGQSSGGRLHEVWDDPEVSVSPTSLLMAAYLEATLSPDPRTQNGALLVDPANGHVLMRAHNEFPRRIADTDARWERDSKNDYVVHAEHNVILRAAARGLSTHGLVLVCPWSACDGCARAMIQAGIATLLRHTNTAGSHWATSIALGDALLSEAGVNVEELDVKPLHRSIRRDGLAWP